MYTHENTKRRVPNNMTEICAANSNDYVMCNGRENIEHGEETITQGNEVRKMRTNVKS